MVGIDCEENRTKLVTHGTYGSMYLYAYGSFGHYINGVGSDSIQYVPNDGDRMQIRVDLVENTVEWLLVSPVNKHIGRAGIPSTMQDKKLYASLQLNPGYTGMLTLK